MEAFRLEAMDYLLKPVDKARLAETIERARRADPGEESRRSADGGRAQAPRRRRGPNCWCGANNRHFIVDANEVIYATIDNGLITLVTTNLEGQSNYRTIEDLQANLDRESSGGCTGRTW